MKKTTKIPVGNVVQPAAYRTTVLREMTRRYGMLHEVQVKNLQIWPSLYLAPSARVSELRYGHEERLIEIDLGATETKGLNLKEGAIKLDKAVKFLLGCDVTLKVVAVGGAIYEGGPQNEAWLTSTPKAPASKSRKKKKPAKNVGKRKR